MGYDFDDLLLLAYKLLTEFPKVADLYRRIYGYICIDEAQDLNEAQYAVLTALCGDTFRNVMMVGDPKQAIYSFNHAGPKYMEKFGMGFGAKIVILNENHRSSQIVVNAVNALDKKYTSDAPSSKQGEIWFGVGNDEADEARIVCDKLQQFFVEGHPDVEGGRITPSQCAILGRNRYTLIHVENTLKERGILFHKRLASTYEYESDVVQEFQLALRVYANPRDQLHLNALAKKWGIRPDDIQQPTDSQGVLTLLDQIAGGERRHRAIFAAMQIIHAQTRRPDLNPCIKIMQDYANTFVQEDTLEERRSIYDDTKLLLQEWDQYLRSDAASTKTIAGFMSNMALGTTRKPQAAGVALLTVHAAKGLEFDVVFIVGMVDGIFPDYRARNNPQAVLEEKRNAFVAVTRSKRLLCLSYPKTRKMPWGDVWHSQPSPYLQLVRTSMAI
ncbi:MAG: ATP-dependent helicase [Magnetococcales bacterium]|nr:ATP-dependent helicase [Magnetococcales bacterium]